MNIAIAGGSGLVGSKVLEIAQNDTKISSIHLIGRRILEMNDPKVHQHIVDFENLSVFELPENIDAVISCLGTTIKKVGKDGQMKVDRYYVANLGKWTLENNIKTFITLSSLGADERSFSFYLRVKGLMEKEINKLSIPNKVIIRPSLILGDRNEYRFGERIAGKVLTFVSPLLIGSLKKQRPVKDIQIAKTILYYVQNPASKIVESNEIRTF